MAIGCTTGANATSSARSRRSPSADARSTKVPSTAVDVASMVWPSPAVSVSGTPGNGVRSDVTVPEMAHPTDTAGWACARSMDNTANATHAETEPGSRHERAIHSKIRGGSARRFTSPALSSSLHDLLFLDACQLNRTQTTRVRGRARISFPCVVVRTAVGQRRRGSRRAAAADLFGGVGADDSVRLLLHDARDLESCEAA